VWARSWWNIGQSSPEETASARNPIDAAQKEVKRIAERIITADLNFFVRNPHIKYGRIADIKLSIYSTLSLFCSFQKLIYKKWKV
jgi:hypothetical protein